jgi:GNAT superfamily N-acetyltransferase
MWSKEPGIADATSHDPPERSAPGIRSGRGMLPSARLADVVEVRRRTDGDLDVLEQLTARVRAADDYPTYLPDEDYRRFLTQPAQLAAWVAELDDRICGHVAVNPESSPAVMRVLRDAGIAGNVGVVARLLVDPDARRRGVARELLQTARAEAVAQQRTPVLDVVESSHAAVAVYRSAGWVEVGRASLVLPDGRELRELVFAAETGE